MPENISLFVAVPANVFAAVIRTQIDAWEKQQDAVVHSLDEWWTDFAAFCAGEETVRLAVESELNQEEAE